MSHENDAVQLEQLKSFVLKDLERAKVEEQVEDIGSLIDKAERRAQELPEGSDDARFMAAFMLEMLEREGHGPQEAKVILKHFAAGASPHEEMP